MKNIIGYSFWGFSLLFTSLFSGCTDSFEKMNVDPINPPFIEKPVVPDLPGDDDINLGKEISSEELSQLVQMGGRIQSSFKTFSYEGVYNDYQRASNLTHDIYAGYFANNNPNFNSSSPNYVYTDGWSAKRWDHFYKERCKEYSELVRYFWYVDHAKHRNAFYITRIYFAFIASQITDTYGPIPFAAYVKGNQVDAKVKYDSQKDVYDMLFRILGQAVDSIKPGESSFVFGKEDNCYRGDEQKWVRFANTLRLRLALRISNVDPARARKEGEAALASVTGLMQTDSDNMTTTPRYAPEDLGGDNAGGDENILALCSFNYLDCVMSKDIELAYKNLGRVEDPRMGRLWFRPSPKSRLERGRESSADFNGCEIGNDEVNRASDVYSVLRCNVWESKVLNDEYWFGYSRESVWLGYSESLFLRAEAALRGWAGAGQSAEEYFRQGIKASFSYFRLGEGVADDYISGLNCLDGDNNVFNKGDKEAILESIISQKWLALFPNGNEAWAEFRRTDYPRLRNHINNKSGDVAINKFIKRLRYPNDEFDYNADNVPSEYFRQDARLWWDVSDTNTSSGERNVTNNFR